MAAFIKLFDRAGSQGMSPPITLNLLTFLHGLNNPDGDVPLHYPIFPGFGNHDLDFATSSALTNYVSNWKPSSQMPGITITNSDSAMQSYSWDWGGLHLINVGVFGGSDDIDYNYSAPSMTWLQNDLKTYASDGRPVIIFQHFGFDAFSLSSAWYESSGRYPGLNGLMSAIANYNVIGIFAGHEHDPLYNYQFPPSTASNNNGQSGTLGGPMEVRGRFGHSRST